jgi:N-acetylneuraminic acid mutarotase
MSLVLLDDGKYLYSIGGLSKMDTNVQLNTSIERLDLTNPNSQWQIMTTKLNEAACDIGCLALSKDEILIFGGWNRNPL